MNGAGWLILAWDVAIVCFAAWEWRYRCRRGPQPGWGERVLRGVTLVAAVAACVMVPIVARPGDQPHETRVNSLLTNPAAMLAVIDLVVGWRKGDRRS